jgi:hypothetical protein
MWKSRSIKIDQENPAADFTITFSVCLLHLCLKEVLTNRTLKIAFHQNRSRKSRRRLHNHFFGMFVAFMPQRSPNQSNAENRFPSKSIKKIPLQTSQSLFRYVCCTYGSKKS